MISKIILRKTVEEIGSITDAELFLLNPKAEALWDAKKQMPVEKKEITEFVKSTDTQRETQESFLFKIFDEGKLDYVIMTGGKGEHDLMAGRITVLQLENLLRAYRAQFGRENYMKNLLRDNLLQVDIYNRAKRLDINVNTTRVVFLVEVSYVKEQRIYDVMKENKDYEESDFITAIDKDQIVYIKEMKGKIIDDQLKKTAGRISRAIRKEGIKNVRVAAGSPVDDIRYLSRSFKEAQIALEVGKIFYGEKLVLTYDALGIARLIYQLPLPLCESYIKETFGVFSPQNMKEETLITINKFFEQNLNVSETARQLFIHRNTLVYRLDKIERDSNLDIRNFEDAISFKIALMIVKYMEYLTKN